MMVEVKEAPAIGFGVPLNVFDRYVGAIEWAGEEPATGWLVRRAVWVVRGQHELQLFYEYCPFGEDACLLVNVVRTGLDIYVVEFWKVRFTAIQYLWCER
jgi:hypothetical protein